MSDARLMITGGHDGRVLMWDVHEGVVLHKHLNRPVERFVGSPDASTRVTTRLRSRRVRTDSTENVRGTGGGAGGGGTREPTRVQDDVDMREVYDVYDAKVSPLGDRIAATDSAGHLLLFAYGDEDAYSQTPDEQFFHNDYQGPLSLSLHIFISYCHKGCDKSPGSISLRQHSIDPNSTIINIGI